MAQNVSKNSHESTEQNSNLSSANTPGKDLFRPIAGKPSLDWEQPDYDELDLCMEVTTYIQNWQ